MCPQRIRLTVISEDLMTLIQAAQELGVDTKTAYRWKDKGYLHVFRIGDQMFVTADEVKALKEKTNRQEVQKELECLKRESGDDGSEQPISAH